jgi:hypothetical protein
MLADPRYGAFVAMIPGYAKPDRSPAAPRQDSAATSAIEGVAHTASDAAPDESPNYWTRARPLRFSDHEQGLRSRSSRQVQHQSAWCRPLFYPNYNALNTKIRAWVDAQQRFYNT